MVTRAGEATGTVQLNLEDWPRGPERLFGNNCHDHYMYAKCCDNLMAMSNSPLMSAS